MTQSTPATGYFRSGLPYNRLGHGPRTLVVFQGLQFENKPLTGPLASGITRFYRFLEDDYTVYLVGRRPGMPAGYTLADMANDYATMIREEFGGPVDVIGLSTGGSIALCFAVEHPDLVRRLVIHSSAYRLGETGRATQREVARLIRQGRWRDASAVLVRTAMPPDEWYTGMAVAAISLLMSLDAPKDPSDVLTTIEAEDQCNFRDRLGEIKAPTLVAGGERDPFYTPELFRETAAGIPNARLILEPEMGHPVEGERFEQEVLAFLAADRPPQQVAAPASTADSTFWRGIYRIGGVAALATVLVALLDIVLSFLPGERGVQPGQLSAEAWFGRFRSSRFLALRDLGLWNVINTVLGIPLYLALYGAHRRISRGPSALALVLAVAGASVYAAGNRALPLLALSDRYASAGSRAERSRLAKAGEAMLRRGEDFTPSALPGFVLVELAGLVMGATMLRSGVFNRWIAWAGLVGTSLLTAFTIVATFFRSAYRQAMVLAIVGGMLSVVWHTLTARTLFRLARSRQPRG